MTASMNVIDCHSDYGIKVMFEHQKGNDDVLKRLHLPQLKKGKVNLECLVVGGDFDFYPQLNSRNAEIIFKTIDIIKSEIEKNSDLFQLILTGNDLKALSNRNCFILTLEGAGSIGSNLNLLEVNFKRGIRFITLTHNERNEIGDGIGVKNPRGLTSFGKKVINKMNQLGMIIDLSHSSNPLFWDVIKNIDSLCITSHSNVKSICNHVRNLTDNQIEAIASQGGVIGMNLYGGFIDLNPEHVTINRLIDHVDYIVDLIGIDYIGIGADLLDYAVEDNIQLNDTSSEEARENPIQIQYPRILSNVSEFSQIFKALKQRGYTKKEIKKIAGENFIRVFKSVLI
jgi:membrane dipeptidase